MVKQVVCAAAWLLGAVLPAQERIEDRLDRIYQRGKFQRDLVEQGAVEAPRNATRDGSRSAPQSPSPPPEVPDWLAKLVGAVAMALPWIAAGLLLVMLVMMVVRARTRPRPVHRAAPPRPPPEETAAIAPAPAAGELPDADALARAGRFPEAIHALLLHAIARIGARAPRAVLPSRTGREIARAAGIDAASAPWIDHIVRAVEVSLFGGRPAGPADYEECAAALARIGVAP